MKTETKAGFTMVEVVLALSVAAFCLLAVLGLLPAGLNSNRAAIMQTEAASIAKIIVTDLRSTPSTSGTSSQFDFSIPNAGATTTAANTLYFAEGPTPVGTADAKNTTVVSGTSQALFRATVSFNPPSTSFPRKATSVNILVTWPAFADPNPTQLPKNYGDSYQVLTALDRN